MSDEEFQTAARDHLSRSDLTYENFRELALNPNLTENEKIGYGEAYRTGYEPAILCDIMLKLPRLSERGRAIVDIGPGCGPLARLLIEHCTRQGHRLALVDCPEMLALLPEAPGVIEVAGRYPCNADAVSAAIGGSADAILCYGVFHTIYVDDNPFHTVDSIIELLAPRGSALIGDIPNVSKRKRFFASAAGIAFHREFRQTGQPPEIAFNRLEARKIDDSVLAALVQRAQAAGCDAYVVPQPEGLRFADIRDDLLIHKP